jgi:hypothetical protein
VAIDNDEPLSIHSKLTSTEMSKGEYFLNYLKAPFLSADLKVLDTFVADKARDYGLEWYCMELRDEQLSPKQAETHHTGIYLGECPFVVGAGFNTPDVALREATIAKAEKLLRKMSAATTIINSETVRITQVADIRTFRAYSDKDTYGMALIQGTIRYRLLT